MIPGIDAGFLQVIPGNFVSRGRTGRGYIFFLLHHQGMDRSGWR